MRTGIFIRGLGLALTVLLAAGCAGGDVGQSVTLPPLPTTTPAVGTTTPPTTSPSAVSTSPTPAATAVRAGPPPKVPETKAGAELFMRDYFATMNDALHHARTVDLRKYYATACHCNNLEELIDQEAADGEHVKGTGFVLEHLLLGGVKFDSIPVTATFSVHHLLLVDASGKTVEHTTDNFTHAKQTYFLEYGATTWVIVDMLRDH